jgi:hypothetical protein
MTKIFDRRKFLRGMSGWIALPALEYFAPTGALAQQAASARRILYCYVPNGAFWQPTGVGTGFELPPVLSPLAALKEYITVVSGLNLPSALDARSGDHARATGAFLTGKLPKFPGPDVARSIDYDLAEIIGAGTRYATLTLGGESGAGSDNGYSEAYQGNFSWTSPTAPSTKETNPQAVFQRLFGGGGAPPPATPNPNAAAPSAEPQARPATDKSVLDYAVEEANTLSASLGSADRQKLDEYLTSVRDLEKRLYSGGGGGGAAGQCTPPAQMGAAVAYEQRIALLYELMYHAFACDLTRVGSFMVANEASNISYGFAGVPRGHHEVSHDDSEGGRQALAGIVKWQIQQLANFLTKLKEANLLDSTLVLFGAGLGNGARHDHENLAVLVAGRAEGFVPGGRHIAANRVPLSNLHLTLAQALGASWSNFGESTGALSLT